ncbi:hypothetical protein [Kitasatospora sp. KL5]|uniref:hypothetical protein n=1 Tax=Kitasatospora sp. KL5 TaxID=3425125 RepID=UPI003D6E5B9A
MPINEWLPDQPVRTGRIDWPEHRDDKVFQRLQTGQTVVLDRQPWLVLEINEYPYFQWPEPYQKSWREHVELWRHSENLHGAHRTTTPPDRANFYKRPVILALRNENLPRSAPKHWCAPASHDWHVLPEHYAVCRACGELPPCRNGEHRWDGGPRRDDHNGSIPLIVPIGCCMGCAELIKPRMRAITFPGPNLWYPELGDGSAAFHTRTSCSDQVDRYRREWENTHIQNSRPAPEPLFPEANAEILALPRTRPAPDQASLPEMALRVSNYPLAASASALAPQAAPAPDRTHPATPHMHPCQPPCVNTAHPLPSAHLGPAASIPQLAGAAEYTPDIHPEIRTTDQASRVIEELTAAVRNIAVYLNGGTNTQTHAQIL